MPTLDDLHATFTDLEQHAPHPRPVRTTDHPQRRAGRRGWVATTLAAAAVVAVAVGIAVVPGRSPYGGTPGHAAPYRSPAAFPAALPAPKTGTSPRLAFGFVVAPVSGYRVRPTSIDATSQYADIRSADGTVHGGLRIYYAGAFSPRRAEKGRPVRVHGRPGYFARTTVPGDDIATYDVLAWQYADGGWAVVDLWDGAAGRTVDVPAARAQKGASATGTEATPARIPRRRTLIALRADELRLAGATHAASTVVRVPIRVAGLPGLHVTQFTTDPGSGGVTLAAAGTAWDLGWGGRGLNAADKPNTASTSVGGRRWLVYLDSRGRITSIGLTEPGFGMTVTPTSAHGDAATLAQYRRFLAHVTVATDLADPRTWFPATILR